MIILRKVPTLSLNSLIKSIGEKIRPGFYSIKSVVNVCINNPMYRAIL